MNKSGEVKIDNHIAYNTTTIKKIHNAKIDFRVGFKAGLRAGMES